MTKRKVVQRTREQVFRRWIKALESDEFIHVKRRLRSIGFSNGRCCLGILCDLCEQDGGPQWTHHTESRSGDYEYMGQRDVLPDVIRDFLGLSVQERSMLIHLNDVMDYTFKEIAQVLRDHLNGKPILTHKPKE